MGFALGGVPELAVLETRILVATDEESTIHAMTSWLPTYRDGTVAGLTLDVIRRCTTGWRPAIEFLTGKAALATQEEGLEILSLSGVPLSRSADNISAFDPLTGVLATTMGPLYGFTSLHAFKRKFKPCTQSLHPAISDLVSLTTVGLAISHAYVPYVSLAQTLTLVTSVAGGLVKLAAKGVGDLRSTRATSRESTSAADTLAVTASSDGNGKEH